MDMKQILAAFDSAGKKPVTGANDMKKFVSIIKENSAPKQEAVITGFEEDSIGGQANAFLISADKINDMVMSEIEKVKINANPELLKGLMNKFNEFMTAYHSVGKEILQPDMFKDDVNVEEGAAEDLAQIEKHPAADDPRIQQAVADKKKELDTKEEGIHNGLAFKDYFALEEAKKKITASEDPCWKGYKMVGTKKKGGKEVPNCVPGKKGD